MKKLRKLFTLLLAVAMVCSMGAVAFAADETDGTIIIEEATIGEAYLLYKVFDATTQGEGDAKTVAYVYTKTGETDALYEALVGEDSPFLLTATSATDKYSVALKDGKTASDVSIFFKANEANLGTTEQEQLATINTVIFTDLLYGYYYIAKASSELPGASVGVTSVASSQTIKDKSTKPGPYTPDPDNPDSDDPNNPGGYKVLAGADGKAIATSENTANYGDTVFFILQAQATNYEEAKKIVAYTAYDVLGEGFKDFAINKVTVDGTEIENYTYTEGSPATILLPWVDADGNHLYASTAIIKIYCQAVVDEDAVIGETGSNTTNTGWFNWEYDNKDENGDPEVGPNIPSNPDKETDTVTTKVYAIAINKTDSTGNALAGANFELTKTDNTGETASVVKIPVTLISEGTETEASVYKYDATSTSYTVVSPTSGKILIKGLESTTYTVNEIVAPDGYNIITEGIVIESTEFSSSTTTMTLYYDEEGNLTNTETEVKTEVTFDVPSAAINVVNLTGTELPSTGGVGTTIFYILGGLLAVSATILLVTQKRMSMTMM